MRPDAPTVHSRQAKRRAGIQPQAHALAAAIPADALRARGNDGSRGGRASMIKAILSGDLPRSRILSVVLVAILVVLALAPFLFSGAQAINTAAKVCVFIVLVASYDLLLGYTGIVSFAHTMFYGLGGYGVGLALYGWGATWAAALAGLADRARRRHRAGLPDRAVLAAGARHLLCHGDAGRRLRLRDPGGAALRHHRRRGRPLVPRAGGAAAGLHARSTCRRSAWS